MTVTWRRDGLPARNLVSRGLLELVRKVHLPGPYPSSCGRHEWTYRLTEKGRRRAAKVLEDASGTAGVSSRPIASPVDPSADLGVPGVAVALSTA